MNVKNITLAVILDSGITNFWKDGTRSLGNVGFVEQHYEWSA
jgi:hypothetical protein